MEQNKEIKQYVPVNPENVNETRVYAALEKILQEQYEQEDKSDKGFFHDHEAFLESMEHVVQDQFSAIRGDKISLGELANRINRWGTFCDAVVNVGVSCIYNQRFAADNDYEKLFKGLRVNASFNSLYLKPRNIVVEFRHKSEEAKEKFPWLAMPCLIIKGNDGEEHEIAITPSNDGRTWWLDTLTNFHNTYNWNLEPGFITFDDDGEPVVDLSADHDVNMESDEEDEMPPVVDGEPAPTELPVTSEEEEAFKAIPEARRWEHQIMRDKDGKFEGMSLYPIPTEAERARLAGLKIKGVEFKSSGEIKMKPEYEYKHSEHGPTGTKRNNEKHYFATNQDSTSEFSPEQKGDSSVSPFFNGITGQRCTPKVTEEEMDKVIAQAKAAEGVPHRNEDWQWIADPSVKPPKDSTSEMLELELNPQAPAPRSTLRQRLAKLRDDFTLWVISKMSR